MSPLTAIAIPAATAAATQLVQQFAAHRPFASFFGHVAGDAPDAGLGLGDLGQMIEDLRTAIADRLAGAGIDPATAFDLSSDSSGQLVVGEHPLRSQIAEALAGDPGIRDQFQRISALQSLLDAAQRHLEFAQRYALDPLAALPGDSEALTPFALQYSA
jgi:hypothetical protein